MLGIAEDERESDVRDVTTTFGLTFPIVHDTGNALSGRFRVSDMPITFVADKKGRIRWVGAPIRPRLTSKPPFPPPPRRSEGFRLKHRAMQRLAILPGVMLAIGAVGVAFVSLATAGCGRPITSRA